MLMGPNLASTITETVAVSSLPRARIGASIRSYALSTIPKRAAKLERRESLNVVVSEVIALAGARIGTITTGTNIMTVPAELTGVTGRPAPQGCPQRSACMKRFGSPGAMSLSMTVRRHSPARTRREFPSSGSRAARIERGLQRRARARLPMVLVPRARRRARAPCGRCPRA